MPGYQQCEFFLLRYVPDAVKDEFVNIAVVLVSSGGFAEVRFSSDFGRVRCLDPTADLEMLAGLEADLRRHLQSGGADRDALLRHMQDAFSGTLQISPGKACLAESPQQELARLAELYLETSAARRPERPRVARGRQAVFNAMRSAFERAGVWDDPRMMKRIAVADFTQSGDPLRIDCGYHPNGVIKLFHALSLATDVDSAKVLAFTFPALQEGIRRRENAAAQLTAIVEDGLAREEESIGFALATLGQAQITVATLAEMDSIAAAARRELKL